MEAWAKYAIQLTNQLGKRGVHTAQPIGEEWNQFWVEKEKHSFFSGENMPASVLLESFTDEQIAQVGLSYKIGRLFPTSLLSAV